MTRPQTRCAWMQLVRGFVVPQLAVILFALGATAEPIGADEGWQDKEGHLLPDTESRKSKSGFGGLLVVSSDPDWEQKWNTPPETIPEFHTVSRVAVGETVVTLIFVVSPKPDNQGMVDVRCDLRVTRPDGSTSMDEKDVECLSGRLPEDYQHNVLLAAPYLGFVGEADDPPGEWLTDVRLTDVNRHVSLDLRTRFTLTERAD